MQESLRIDATEGVEIVDVELPTMIRCGPDVSRRELAALATVFAGMFLSPFASHSLAGKNKKKKKKHSNNSSRKAKRSKSDGKNRGSGSASGEAIVNYAQKFKGTPYELGGESPRGFDCSGFTWYVFNHEAGMDIGRTEDEQWKQGNSVSRDAWQPGDLVFFENTFERGLSHVGIYMNGENFIHAENDDTGVVVSSMSSDYYKSHYAGARRLV
jgi:cell wall-associated NlpC family hydrolase